MKNKADKVLRLVLAGIGVAAVEIVTIPGIPAWLIVACKVAAGMAGGASPSLVGVKRTTFVKSATPGGALQADDAEVPKR